MGKYFGTDGFRGEANKALTAQKAFQVGRYIGWYYGQKHDDKRAKIIIGRIQEEVHICLRLLLQQVLHPQVQMLIFYM